MQRDAIHHRAHAELPHAVVNVVATLGRVVDRNRQLVVRVVGTCEVGRTAEHFRDRGAEHVQHLLRRGTRGNRRRLFDLRGDELLQLSTPVHRQLAPLAPLEFGRETRMGRAVGREALLPGFLDRGAFRPGVPAGTNVVGHDERSGGPAEFFAGGCDLGVTQRRAVRGLGALLVGRAPADDGLAADQRRPRIRLGGLDRSFDRRRVVAVDVRHDVPAVGFESLRRVVREPAVHFTVDRDAVVVVEAHELAELERAGQRAGFVRDALHQAAVAEEHVSVVVDDFVPGLVERGREQLLGERHADGIGETLAERARRGLDAEVPVDFRVARRVRAELPETRQVIDGERITREVQQRIEQHRAVPVRQHETVAIGPCGVARVVPEVVRPQHLRDVGHAHRHAGVTGIGLLDRIHAQRPDGVGELPACGHREPSWKSGHFSVRAGAGSHEF